ncbi:hypothetical protein QQX98_009539 [Neonectria punicea]|uniref:Carbohydrate-binding module family 19 domain-containing protein n=1 Tax=Neonectria punicea TaxID=979145 RepID=A0ABR1GSC6_9HYPO
MRFDRRRTAIALHILLTAQFTQAGPLRWTRRIYPRDVTTTPAGNDYTASLAPTAAHDSSDGESGGPETTPRPIFETLTSSIAFPESAMSQSSSAGIPVEVVPIDDTTSEAESKPTEATTSEADSIVSTNLAVTPTLTTSIVPEQPSDSTSPVEETTTPAKETSTVAEETSTAAEKTSTEVQETSTAVQETSTTVQGTSTSADETSTAVEGTTTAVEETSKPIFTQETSGAILTTSIVPKQPGNGTTPSEPAATPTSAVVTSEVTSIPQATSILTSSIVPKDPTTVVSSSQIETPGLSTSLITASAPADTTAISSTPATASYETVSTPRNMPGTAPGSSIMNTPLTTLTAALPTSETSVTAPGSTIYQETPSEATSATLPGSSTVPDEGLQYSTSATMQSSIDLGDLKPTSTAIEQTTSVVVSTQPATTSLPTTSLPTTLTTSIINAPSSSVVPPPQESSVVETLPETSVAVTSISVTSESVPETTLTVTVADPGKTDPAGSTVVETSSSESVPSEPASSSEAAVPSTTSSPATTVSEIMATGAPDTAVPPASPMPTETATVDADQYAANLAQAKRLNKVYAGLTPESACSASQAACINDQLAQCGDTGTYVLSTCGANRKCYALPMTTNRGVRLGCEDVDKAEKILGETGDNNGQDSTSVIEEPATTSAAEEPVATSAAEEQPNVPVVTVTEIVTVDDGAASQPTSEPANEVSTESVQQPAKSTTISEPSSEQPANDQPTETTSEASAPESSAPVSRETTSVAPVVTTTSVAPVVTTTSVPAAEDSSSALPSGNTLTKSIKQPGDSITSEEASEPTSTSEKASKATTTAKPTTVVLIPIDDTTTGAPGAAATEAAAEDKARTTTQVVDGTPTVSVFMTVTVTEKDHETVTVTEKERVTVVISA